jgi:hypothetical protein
MPLVGLGIMAGVSYFAAKRGAKKGMQQAQQQQQAQEPPTQAPAPTQVPTPPDTTRAQSDAVAAAQRAMILRRRKAGGNTGINGGRTSGTPMPAARLSRPTLLGGGGY